MTIAIAADSSLPDHAQIAMQAARAPFYLLFDENGVFLNAIENPWVDVERGAAPRAARLLREHRAAMLIAGDFGPRLMSELDKAHITVTTASGPLSEALEKIQRHSGAE
jgi:predicted Fe-Mo cluster-binding NifX family protein